MGGAVVTVEVLRAFVRDVLFRQQVRADVAEAVADGLVQASVRGVDSHGVRLLPHYVAAVHGGRINPQPRYRFERTTPSTGRLDADHTFGHAAGREAARRAIELATDAGTGQIAVYNSSHFGAAAYFALEIAKHDMIGMSFTNTDALEAVTASLQRDGEWVEVPEMVGRNDHRPEMAARLTGAAQP